VPLELPLRTARLELRAFTPADLPAAHRIYADPDVMRHVGHGPVAHEAAAAEMLGAYMDHQRAHGFSFWAVIERASGELIGDAGLFRHHGAEEVELGYTLARAWWGRGYATEAARACLDAAFGPLGIEEVTALVEPANRPSRRVLEKLGMRPAGRREAYGREHLVFRARR
jgi:ribosomal-protein-alanine N-acetyltransferase